MHQGSVLAGLRRVLRWDELKRAGEPTLLDVHPSFVNNDVVSRIIDDMRVAHFPEGTGWEGLSSINFDFRRSPADVPNPNTLGVEHFKHYQDSKLDKEDHYVRSLKKFKDAKKGDFEIGVCMFPGQSRLFHQAKWITADTSFKRFKNYDEFGMEYWDEESKKCMFPQVFPAPASLTTSPRLRSYLLMPRYRHCRSYGSSPTALP